MTLTIEDGIVHLDRAIGILGPDFPGEVEAAGRTAERVRGRVQVGGQHTVVVLAGATGSGKSSLLNALAGESVSRVAPTRPTTDAPLAVSGSAATEVLDWMGVDSRRVLPGALGEDRLVVVDLPDLDSIEHRHRSVADSLIERADAVVFVLDPQKYADAALHDGYLRGLGARQEDMLVLVNQVDTLPESGLASLLDDVGSLLKDDGLSQVQVLPVSAVRGDNLDVVRSMLRQRVARESNAARTASAELDAITRRLRPTVARNKVELDAELTEETTKVLLQASGAQAVEDSVRAGLSRVLPRALARPEPPSRTAVSSAHSTWVHRTSQGLPPTWARSLEASVASPETLAGQTAEAVGSVALPGHRQPLIDLLWWGGLLMVLGGVSWLTASVVREGLEVLHRSIEIAPVCLVAVGLLALLIATVRRRSRARREAQRYGQRVRDRLDSVVERGLSRPAGKILDKHRVLQSALGL